MSTGWFIKTMRGEQSGLSNSGGCFVGWWGLVARTTGADLVGGVARGSQENAFLKDVIAVFKCQIDPNYYLPVEEELIIGT